MGRNKASLLLLSFLFIAGSLLSACSTTSHSAAPVITPSQAVLQSGQVLQFSASVNGIAVAQPAWQVNGVAGGSAATGTISNDGLFTAPTTLSAPSVSISVSDGAKGTPSMPAIVQFFDPSNFTAGSVAATNNPLVASYSFVAPDGATVRVRFGADTNYGLRTWAQPVPDGGGTVTVLVAGMRASTTYHMQALVHLIDGTDVVDSDHQFATGALTTALLPNLAAEQTAGTTLAPGVEVLCLDPQNGSTQLTAVITDLSGNVIWYYDIGEGEWPYPMKLLPNGHMLVVAAPATNAQGGISPTSATSNEVREIDLAGTLINEIKLDDVNKGLTAIGADFQAQSLHHDILPLPNGHFILLVNFGKTFDNLPGQPPGTVVGGDGLVDWDPKSGPVWAWSAFDHLDVSHAPYGVADWTHGNALTYSPDDQNIILSMRNQNWIVKINYGNGSGDGTVLWRFGKDGDFTLPAGEDPIEWNYGQHYPTILSPNSTGVFDMMFFNNGNARLVNEADAICGSGPVGIPACYSSVPIFEVNEDAKTAKVISEDSLAPAYSLCCGDAQQLSNGDLEYDVAFNLFTPGVSTVQEATQEQTPQLVWQMNITGQLAYRAFRIPSLYPGVEWTQAAINAPAPGGSQAGVLGQAPTRIH